MAQAREGRRSRAATINILGIFFVIASVGQRIGECEYVTENVRIRSQNSDRGPRIVRLRITRLIGIFKETHHGHSARKNKIDGSVQV